MLAEAEGVDLGAQLSDDIIIHDEWMEEMDYADEFTEFAERQREEEEERSYGQYRACPTVTLVAMTSSVLVGRRN